MIFMCSMTSLKGARSFMRSWLVMVAGTVRMQTIALRLTSSVSDVILLQILKKMKILKKAQIIRQTQLEIHNKLHLNDYPCDDASYSCDSLGLVEVHDAVDDLHRRVPAEEGDLVGQLLGGRVGRRAGRLGSFLRGLGSFLNYSRRFSVLL